MFQLGGLCQLFVRGAVVSSCKGLRGNICQLQKVETFC